MVFNYRSLSTPWGRIRKKTCRCRCSEWRVGFGGGLERADEVTVTVTVTVPEGTVTDGGCWHCKDGEVVERMTSPDDCFRWVEGEICLAGSRTDG